ncbi:MAG: NTP transferase domain-containing protein [Spirochaetales bacterium]|nr:NTP transferase domain-containing protein [Spirochaetales bacterium]
MVKHVVIMAGGAGKRLWPASNKETPKQLLELNKGKSLLYGTLDRAFALNVDGRIIIVTHKDQVDGCIEACRDFTDDQRKKVLILAEPVARNTAPALALAAGWIKHNGSVDDTVLVLAADHLITPVEAFIHDAETASRSAGQGFLVTFGIKPSFPSTGYGYVESSVGDEPVRDVLSFREKPDRSTAEEFLARGNYFWNSGMFAYSVKTFLEELASSSPAIAGPFAALDGSSFPLKEKGGVQIPADLAGIEAAYARTTADSVDYAVMEKSRRIKVVPATMGWNDVGSWDVIAEENLTLPSDILGEADRSNYVYSDLPVALCGVKDLIVVVKNGSVLICKKGESQLVKGVVDSLKDTGRDELL